MTHDGAYVNYERLCEKIGPEAVENVEGYCGGMTLPDFAKAQFDAGFRAGQQYVATGERG